MKNTYTHMFGNLLFFNIYIYIYICIYSYIQKLIYNKYIVLIYLYIYIYYIYILVWDTVGLIKRPILTNSDR